MIVLINDVKETSSALRFDPVSSRARTNDLFTHYLRSPLVLHHDPIMVMSLQVVNSGQVILALIDQLLQWLHLQLLHIKQLLWAHHVVPIALITLGELDLI